MNHTLVISLIALVGNFASWIVVYVAREDVRKDPGLIRYAFAAVTVLLLFQILLAIIGNLYLYQP